MHIQQYIDGWFMRARKTAMPRNKHRLLYLVKSLGWIINYGKSGLVPTQEIEFLGYNFNFSVGLVFQLKRKSVTFSRK